MQLFPVRNIIKLTKSWRSEVLIFSTILQNHLLNFSSLSDPSLDSSLNVVYDINVETFMSPTPFNSRRKSSAVKLFIQLSGSASNTPSLTAWKYKLNRFHIYIIIMCFINIRSSKTKSIIIFALNWRLYLA